MLSDSELKRLLHSDLQQKDKLLFLLACFEEPRSITDLRDRARTAGFQIPKTWNPSATLAMAKGLAIRTPTGWEITDDGKSYLQTFGVTKINAAGKAATDLRGHLPRISDGTTRAFVEEAIKCYEHELYRSAIVMSWIAAMDVLYHAAFETRLADFNNEAKRVDHNWKGASSLDDLARMKEGDFLDRLVSISLIGKNVKAELKQCLDRRNGCGHPNSLKIGPNTAAHHLEILLLNVFQPFA